jgi:hypothetical protein
MPELVLPGVYIDVRDEGLITPGRITVGNIGVVGTASKGEVGKALLISSATDARDRFGPADAFIDGAHNELSLVRAIELAYENGASTIWAVRIASSTAPPQTASFSLPSAGGVAAVLEAVSPGTWGNNIAVNVAAAEDGAFIEGESHAGGAATVTLDRSPIAKVGRNRVRVKVDATGQTKEFLITYGSAGTPPLGSVLINDATGVITFAAAEAPAAADKVIVNYEIPKTDSAKVTFKAGTLEEVYTVADGAHLVDQIKLFGAESQLVKGTNGPNSDELPSLSSPAGQFDLFGKGTNTAGSNGESVTDADVKSGLVPLLNEAVHIVVAAGMDNTQAADELKAHCEVASTDKMKADRIAVVGSQPNASFDQAQNPGVDSDRVVYVTPGFIATDAVSGVEVKFPGSYTAAVIAGMLSANDAHISLTNKAMALSTLESRFTQPQLTQLVQNHVLAAEQQRGRGVRVVKAITTSSNSAFHQITTRRIVDFAKYGVRSAASPYIGRLNNERVRAALKATVVSFLQEMLDSEMLVAFEVDVFATRADEIKGIANVTIGLQPTFSIDFIKVTMFLS